MHEYSIVQALITQCEDQARVHNAKSISQVTIKIGKLSGVEPHLLEVAFDTFKEKTICHDAKLVMHIQDVIIQCQACGKQSILTRLHYICHHCKSTHIKVIDGEDMLLMQLALEQEDT